MQLHYPDGMDDVLKLESTLTDRYQTTVPNAVRRALKLGKRDKICYVVKPDGTVQIKRSEKLKADPVLESFLNFIAVDMQAHPERLRSIDRKLATRIRKLTGGIKVDLNAPLSPDDE